MIYKSIKHRYIKSAGAAVAVGLIFSPIAGFAQAPNGQWFVPGQARPAASPPGPRQAPRPPAAQMGTSNVLPMAGDGSSASG